MVKHTVYLYVEGGGNNNPSLASEVRQAFHEFFVKAGLVNKPRVIASGGRTQAYNDYRKAIKQAKSAMLLVDSECPVKPEFECGDIHDWKPWEQLRSRLDDNGNMCDNWEAVGENDDCHLMVQLMETWFLAESISVDEDIEKIPKGKVLDYMNKLFGKYEKGQHSFITLNKVNPLIVQNRSKWVKRFLVLLQEKMAR